MPKTKVENGRTYVLYNGRWHLKDANQNDIEVRNGRNGKEYRVKGEKEWQSTQDGTSQGEVAGNMNANTVNREAIAGDLRPDKAKPSKVKGTNLGENYISSPWKYDSPMAYLKAYAMSKPKTKVGKYLFDAINTLTWLNAWYKTEHPETKESKAIDQGYEEAVRNIDGWLGNIDPEKNIDSITSAELSSAYRQARKKMKELEYEYQQAIGKNDPDSIRIKTEYKTYKKFYDKLDADIQGRQMNEDRQRRMDEARQRARQANSTANAGYRQRASP